MRIFFTGGSGKAGRHVIRYLLERGHRVLNADLHPLDERGVDNLTVDITDSGQVWGAMTAMAGLDELDAIKPPAFDAVVHFAAIPRILVRPDAETFRVNALGTFNVLDAASKLGIPKIVFASSETTYGICFARGERRPDYLPVDEDHPTVPEDAYAMSKVANEACARSFQARTGGDVYGFRINNVIEPHQYARDFPAFVADPALRRRNIFAYIDARDLGHAVECALGTDGLGYQVFNIANDDSSVAMTTPDLIERFYAGVPVRQALTGHASPYSNARARKLLGFRPVHGWRDKMGRET